MQETLGKYEVYGQQINPADAKSGAVDFSVMCIASSNEVSFPFMISGDRCLIK